MFKTFFGDWCNYQGYSDVGYFIGCQFVKSLAEKYPIDQLAKLDSGSVYNKFKTYVLEVK